MSGNSRKFKRYYKEEGYIYYVFVGQTGEFKFLVEDILAEIEMRSRDAS